MRLQNKMLAFLLILIWPNLLFSAALNLFPANSRINESLLAELKPVSPETINSLRKIDPEILPESVDIQDVLQVTLPVARTAFKYMIEEGWGSMNLFAHPIFVQDKRYLFYPNDVLSALNKEYEIPAIFPLHGHQRKNVTYNSTNIAKGTYFKMEGVLLGRGKCIIIYPHPVAIHRDDPIFGFFTGNYDLYRVNIALIGSKPNGPYNIKSIIGRNNPLEVLRPIYGPMNVTLRQMTLSHDFQSVRVNVGMANIIFKHPKFAYLTMKVPFLDVSTLSQQ